MQSLYAVIDDVYAHTVAKVLDLFSGTSPQPTVLLPYPPPADTQGVHAEPLEHKADAIELPPTFRPLGVVIGERDTVTDRSHTIAYVASARTPLFATPTKEFDTVITTLPYGAMVMVLEEKGRFSRVSETGRMGWVVRDDLADRAAYVYPEFVVGEENGPDDPNTLRLRACIEDAFYGGESESALHAGEYVLYKLMRRGARINWPPTRPRVPGRWHTILRGTPGVYMHITPKSGAIMECMLEQDMGHLAYVEAVFPDDRIMISEVNYPDRGIYSERALTKEEWQACGAVFIEVK